MANVWILGDAEVIWGPMFASYLIVFPVLITIGFLTNTISIVILLKPRLRNLHVNRYFLVLVVSDLLVCVLAVPISITLNGCYFFNSAMAYYYAHFAWPLLETLQDVSFYIIICLSYDRFLATLYPMRFKESQKYEIFRCRIVGLVVLSTTIHLPFIFFGTVDIINEDQQYNTVRNISFHRNQAKILVHDGYHSINSTWYKILLTSREIIDVWVPMTLLLLLNLAQVAAMICSNNVFAKTICKRMRRRKILVNITLMTKASLFFIFSIPISIYDYILAERYENVCHGSNSVEMFRGIAKSLKLCQHVIHIFFLVVLNVTFKKELRGMSHSMHRKHSQKGIHSTISKSSGGNDNKSKEFVEIKLI